VNDERSDPLELQRIALDMPRLTLGDLADALGEGQEAMQRYRRGDAEMPPILRHRLAEFLREHAATLNRLALEIDRSG
jgi:hypothetical protein